MGRQASVTLDHVRAAVAALRAEGKSVSSRLVREQLGNVGSMGTINKLLQQALGDRTARPESLRQLPPELQRAIFTFADQQAEDARSQIADELLHCRHEMTSLADDNEALAITLDEIRAHLTTKVSEVAGIEGQVRQLVCELTNARDETVAERHMVEALRIDVTKLQLHIEALAPFEESLRQARMQCELQTNARIELEKTVTVLESRRESLETRTLTLQAELADSRSLSNKLADKIENITGLLEKERDARMLAERDLAIALALQVKRQPKRNPKNGNSTFP